MRTWRSSGIVFLATCLLLGGTARAGEADDPRYPRQPCPVTEVVTPIGVVPQVICGPATRRGPFSPPLLQQYPPPVPRAPWPLQYPPLREVGMHLSGNLVTDDNFGMIGGSYTRSLTDEFALEGTVDGTSRRDHAIGFGAVRAIARHYNPEFGEAFAAMGIGGGFSGGDHRIYPHGLGFVVGGGVQPRFSRHAAGRFEVQMLRFSHEMIGLRVTTGVLVGFD